MIFMIIMYLLFLLCKKFNLFILLKFYTLVQLVDLVADMKNKQYTQ